MKNDIIRLKRGYNINITDDHSQEIIDIGKPATVAVKPIDFEGLKLKPVVEIGSSVKCGEILGFDKNNQKIKLTSPATGKIVAINRGHRRVITEIIIESSEDSENVIFDVPEKVDRQNTLKILLDSGLFLFFKQRPFNIIADPNRIPRDIFISAMDTAPMAADVELILKGNEDYFQSGLSVISQLTTGNLHLSSSTKTGSTFERFKDVDFHLIEGKHPAGNVGVQIHHINPILNREDVVWTIGLQGVIMIGKLFEKKEIDPEILIKVSGSSAIKRQYYRTVLGANISAFVQAGKKARIISGNVLTGRQIPTDGFIGCFDNLISVIPEAEGYEFIGWIAPGFNKHSFSRSFLSTLLKLKKPFNLTTKKHGSTRAFVLSGLYEKYLPMDILPDFLMKAIIIKDIEEMEQLGIYEVVEEDVAILEYLCPSKIDWQKILRNGINLILREA